MEWLEKGLGIPNPAEVLPGGAHAASKGPGCTPEQVPAGHCSWPWDKPGPPRVLDGFGDCSPSEQTLVKHWQVKFSAGTRFVLPLAPCFCSDFLDIFPKDLDEGTECTLSKCADTKLGGVAGTPSGCTAIR